VLAASMNVGAGSSFQGQNQNSLPVSDLGLTDQISIDVGATVEMQGQLRFAGASAIANSGTLIDDGVTQNDTVVGVIATIPDLIQSYMALASEAIQILDNSPFNVTVYLPPGVSFCPTPYTATSVSFELTGGLNDTYIVLISGDATFDDCRINLAAPNLVWVLDNNSNLGAPGDLFFGTFLGPPINALCGMFLFAGSLAAQQGGSLTIQPGRILGGPGSTVDIGIGLSAVVVTPAFLDSSIIQASALQLIPLPNPNKC
jgi:hypothetical protein